MQTSALLCKFAYLLTDLFGYFLLSFHLDNKLWCSISVLVYICCQSLFG